MYPLIILIGIGIAAVGTILDPPKKKGVDSDAPIVPGSVSDDSDKSGQTSPTDTPVT